MAILIRWLGAFVLLALTYNPTPWNYIDWARANFATQMPLTLLAGLVLALGYLIYVTATLRSMGLLGVLLTAALFGLLLWLLIDWGILGLGNSAVDTWLAILALSLILGVGLSWSILWQRMSGQASVDEVER
jgi:Family of unknown function (DUF6524)